MCICNLYLFFINIHILVEGLVVIKQQTKHLVKKVKD
jgi:hypothetical protein